MKNGLHIDKRGTKSWYLDGKLHSQDGPAVVYANGSEFWYLHGKCHRQDGPAVVYADGTQHWYLNGKILGEGAKGFWAHWEQLAHQQRCDLNLHEWLAKYT